MSALAELSTNALEDLDGFIERKLSAVGELRWRRDLTEAEKRVDLVKLNEQFDQAEVELATAVEPVMKKQRARLIDQANEVLAHAKTNGGTTLAADVSAMNAGYLGAYQSAIYQQLEKFHQFGRQAVLKELGVSHKAAEPPSGITGYLKQLAERLARDASNKMGERASGVLFDALMKQLAIDEEDWLLDFDEESLSELVSDSLDDYMPRLAKEQANRSVGIAINGGREDGASTASEEIQIETAQWSAILDHKTCPLCELLDEMRISVDDPDFHRFRPGSLHYNTCRCIWIWLTTNDPDSGDFTWESPPDDLVAEYAPNVI